MVLAAPDKDTSEWSAESLGRVEVETLSEGVSYETTHGGVTLSTRRDLRPLVLPAEVARLENLTGYLKFPGAWPVARIGLTYKDRDVVAARFEPREDDGERGGRPQVRAVGIVDDGAAPEPGAGQSGSSAEMADSREPAPPGRGAGQQDDDMPACIDGAGVEDRKEAGSGEAAVLGTMEWTRGTESLPAPANDMHDEPDWLFEGYGPAVDPHGYPADASAAGRAGSGGATMPTPSRDDGGGEASEGEAPPSGGSAPTETREGSATAGDDEGGTEKSGKRNWI